MLYTVVAKLRRFTPTGGSGAVLLLPLSPELAADGEETTTGLGQIGLFVNGVSIFGWGDGMSYNNDRVWFNLAPIAESLDLDICPGHSANGEYHHHSYPACLAAELGDDGQDHSPIYGFAADGFPIYGPWVAVGQLAESSWVTRDLDDPDSPYACGEVGVRTCVMVDQMDPTLGVITADSAGPDTTDEVESLSGNTFTASAGYYFEDHYYDEARNDGTLAALDDHNGHDHDGLGYHYHVTSLLDDDGRLVDVFPYYLGPQLAGVVLEMSR